MIRGGSGGICLSMGICDILFYVTLIWCSGVPYICGQLVCGVHTVQDHHVHSTIYKASFGVVVFHRSMVDRRRGVCLSWVYMDSSICKTYLV